MILYRRTPLWAQLDNGRHNSHNGTYNHRNCARPATNIMEQDDQYMLTMALPGYTKKDIIIDIDKDVLNVSSSMEDRKEIEKSTLMREFNILPFSRRFQLPESADLEGIAASFRDGVLTVSIPKKEYARTKPPREIAIA